MTTHEATHTTEILATDALDLIDVNTVDNAVDNAVDNTLDSEASAHSDDAVHARRSARADEVAEAAGEIVGAAVDIGRAWARYGLQISKLALETHARTMGNLAVAVGQAAQAVDAVASNEDRA